MSNRQIQNWLDTEDRLLRGEKITHAVAASADLQCYEKQFFKGQYQKSLEVALTNPVSPYQFLKTLLGVGKLDVADGWIQRLKDPEQTVMSEEKIEVVADELRLKLHQGKWEEGRSLVQNLKSYHEISPQTLATVLQMSTLIYFELNQDHECLKELKNLRLHLQVYPNPQLVLYGDAIEVKLHVKRKDYQQAESLMKQMLRIYDLSLDFLITWFRLKIEVLRSKNESCLEESNALIELCKYSGEEMYAQMAMVEYLSHFEGFEKTQQWKDLKKLSEKNFRIKDLMDRAIQCAKKLPWAGPREIRFFCFYDQRVIFDAETLKITSLDAKKVALQFLKKTNSSGSLQLNDYAREFWSVDEYHSVEHGNHLRVNLHRLKKLLTFVEVEQDLDQIQFKKFLKV